MKKIVYALCALGLAFAGCKEEKVIEPGPQNPQIIALYDGEFLRNGDVLAVDVADLPLTISSTVPNVDVATYEWKINGTVDEDATTGKFEFDSERTGTFPVSLSVISKQGKKSSLDFTVEIEGPYKEGLVIYSGSYAGLAFQSTDTYYYDLMSKVVGDSGSGTVQDIYLEDNAIYFLLSNGKIVACDAQTFNKLDEYGTFSGIATPYRLIKAAEGKFYISTDNMGRDKQGLWVYEKQQDDSWAVSAAPIAGTELAPASKPIRVGDYILIGAGDDIAVIDPATDEVVPHDKNGITISTDRKVTDVLKGNDGYIYAVAYSTKSSVSSSIIKIDPVDFSFVDETEMLEGDAQNKVYQTSYASQSHATASITTDDIFVMGSKGIYKFDCSSKTTSLFASMSFSMWGGDGAGIDYMQMGADKENVYVGLTNTMSSTIYKLDIATGAKSTLRSNVTGDASVMSTYQFADR